MHTIIMLQFGLNRKYMDFIGHACTSYRELSENSASKSGLYLGSSFSISMDNKDTQIPWGIGIYNIIMKAMDPNFQTKSFM